MAQLKNSAEELDLEIYLALAGVCEEWFAEPKNYEPWLGNQGNTLDYWYARGAVVLCKNKFLQKKS